MVKKGEIPLVQVPLITNALNILQQLEKAEVFENKIDVDQDMSFEFGTGSYTFHFDIDKK